MSQLLPPPGERVLQISELTACIRELLEEVFPDTWVEGEISNLSRPNSGHVYLTLKDATATLRSVLYRGVALRVKFDLRDGMRVLARGRLSVYEPRGEYQLRIEQLEPKGIGALELAMRQRRERLFALGYFDKHRKRPLPRFPCRVALVCSATGSAVRDLLEILGRRWPLVEVWIHPSRVQGDEAAEEIAAAIGSLNLVGKANGPTPIDVIVLARGGGSLEDLWPFNEEIVAHAIFRSRIPVVTGIGHEDDLTIADLVADQRALTPSEAGERIVPDQVAVSNQLEAHQSRLRTLLGRMLVYARSRLEQLESRPCLTRPESMLEFPRVRVEELRQRLQRSMEQLQERARNRFQTATALLDGLSPLKVLTRGYSVTRKFEDLSLIRMPQQVSPGEVILTQLANGFLKSRVEEVIHQDSRQGIATP